MLENVKQADNPDVYVKEPKDQIQTKEFKKWFGNSKQDYRGGAYGRSCAYASVNST